MKLSQRLDIVVLVLVILYVLTGCTITTDPDDLGPCLQWADVQVTEKSAQCHCMEEKEYVHIHPI